MQVTRDKLRQAGDVHAESLNGLRERKLQGGRADVELRHKRQKLLAAGRCVVADRRGAECSEIRRSRADTAIGRHAVERSRHARYDFKMVEGAVWSRFEIHVRQRAQGPGCRRKVEGRGIGVHSGVPRPREGVAAAEDNRSSDRITAHSRESDSGADERPPKHAGHDRSLSRSAVGGFRSARRGELMSPCFTLRVPRETGNR